MILLIDNYDSFTYNLVQYFQSLRQKVLVYTHDQISIQQIKSLAPQFIVISPGPNTPNEAGISLDVIRSFYQDIPILGVCLGHQCLAQVFGGKIIPASEVIHGKISYITHNNQGLFKNIPNDFAAVRYHSLAVDPRTIPDCLSVDAWTKDTIMAISHRQYPLFGLQFHPEAILSQFGMQILENFLNYERQAII